LHRAPQPSTWQTNWTSIVGICSRVGITSKQCWPSGFPPLGPLPDEVTEADELYQNATQKGRTHRDPHDPPRRRANKARGHGTWDTDRPPIAGLVGRSSGQLRLQVCGHSDRATLQPFVEAQTRADATVNTDEWQAYRWLPETGRCHQTVCHTPGRREWARDDDGDGIREVHTNTIEGLWTGVRNFLRPFRGVSKWYLDQYSAIFEWAHNLKRVTVDFLRAMMIPFTPDPT
jgi:transposase